MINNNSNIHGIVLKQSRGFNEADKIIKLFTWEFGKISVFAKGISKIKSRLIGNLEPFSYIKAQIYKGKNFYYINQAKTVKAFLENRESLKKIYLNFYLVELLDRFLVEEFIEQEIFKLLFHVQNWLSKDTYSLSFLKLFFETRLLIFSGLLPPFNNCTGCNQVLKDIEINEKIAVSPEEGCFFCKDCIPVFENKILTLSSVKYLKILKQIMNIIPKQMKDFIITDIQAKKVGTILKGFITTSISSNLYYESLANNEIFKKEYKGKDEEENFKKLGIYNKNNLYNEVILNKNYSG